MAFLAALLTALAALSAVTLRWLHLGGQSLWYDEGYTALASSLSVANLVHFAQSDTYPPLYPLLQHFWSALFGNSEAGVRGVSAFCGILSVPIFYLFASKVLKNKMAVAFAMWLFAFSTMQIWYSREARAYELASFLALVSLTGLVFFLERKTKTLFAIIVACVAASLYTHNMMFFYVFALNVTWLTYPSERSWKERAKEALLADILAGILYLPWVPSLLRQMSVVQGGFWVPKPTISSLIGTFGLLAGFSAEYLTALATRLMPLPRNLVWVCIVSVVSLFCAGLFSGGFWGVSRTEKMRNLSLSLYGLIPILSIFLLSRVSRPLYIDRVFIDSSIIAPIVLAFPLAAREKRNMLWSALALIVALGTSLSAIGYLRNHPKEDWRDATASLGATPGTNRLVVFIPTAGMILFDYYGAKLADGTSDISRIGLPSSFLEKFPPRLGAITGPKDITPLKTAMESRDYSEVDLVVSPESGPDLEPLASRYLEQSFESRGERNFNGVSVIRFIRADH